MTPSREALLYIGSHPVGRRLPISDEHKRIATLAYTQERVVGKSHTEAVTFARSKIGISPLVMVLLSVAFQILWALLKKWWDNRNASNSC